MNEEMNNQSEELYISEEEVRWQVTDDQGAEWCLAKIREANAEKEKWRGYYEEQLRKINKREDCRIAFFENKLAIYFGSVPHKETKTQQSYQLPSGKLVLKKQGPEWEHDDEKLLPWIKDNYEGDFIKVKESINWSALKKAFQEDECIDTAYGGLMTDSGEIIPGIHIVDRPEKFVVEVK